MTARSIMIVRGRRSARVLSSLIAAASMLGLVACKGGDEKTATERAPAPVIEPVAGMKYFVGGPVMELDRFGHMRLKGFTGQVSAPTTRGLLIGFKRQGPDGNDFDYRTYINGSIVSSSTGFLDEDELLWYRERFTFDSEGKVIARQTLEYDDEREIMTSHVEHVDPTTGEVINVVDSEHPYRPLADDVEDDDSFFEEDEEVEGAE